MKQAQKSISRAREEVAEFRLPLAVRLKAAAGYGFVMACVAAAGAWLCWPHLHPAKKSEPVVLPADFMDMQEAAAFAQVPRTDSSGIMEAVDIVAASIVEENVANYLSRGWRVKKRLAGEIVTEAVNAGYKHGIDPLLIISVAAVESSFNVDAKNASGAEGLMQVHMPVHSQKFEEGEAASEYGANIDVGTGILREYLEKTGSVADALRFYVGAGNLRGDGGYGRKVMAERSRLALAAEGSVDTAVNLLRRGRGAPGCEKGLEATSAPFEDYLESGRRAVRTVGEGLAVQGSGSAVPAS